MLQQQMQEVINNISATTGYAISVGFVNPTHNFGIGSGPRDPVVYQPVIGGTTGGNDTMLLGSGTKPFTATAVMRLVEAGIIQLHDPVAMHVDSVLQALLNETMASLFKTYGANVTVLHLLSMRSGIADFDVASFDNKVLTSDTPQSPVDILAFASTLPWACAPGNCTYYSSTNYVLLGFLLLRYARVTTAEQYDWTALDLTDALGRNATAGITFATTGSLNQSLTVAGT